MSIKSETGSDNFLGPILCYGVPKTKNVDFDRGIVIHITYIELIFFVFHKETSLKTQLKKAKSRN